MKSVDHRAVIAVGPMSSGTRLLTKILIAGGCDGDPGHQQRFDTDLPPVGSGPIVWRRSFPHGSDPKMPSITTMVGQLSEAGWYPHVVAIFRDPTATERSSVARQGFVSDLDDARQWYEKSSVALACQLGQVSAGSLTVVTYESFVLHRPSQKALWRRLGLPGSLDLVEVTDENEKHLCAPCG